MAKTGGRKGSRAAGDAPRGTSSAGRQKQMDQKSISLDAAKRYLRKQYEANATQSFFSGNELEACLNFVWDNDDDKGKGKFSVRMNKMLDDSKGPADILQSFMDFCSARGLPKALEDKNETDQTLKVGRKKAVAEPQVPGVAWEEGKLRKEEWTVTQIHADDVANGATGLALVSMPTLRNLMGTYYSTGPLAVIIPGERDSLLLRSKSAEETKVIEQGTAVSFSFCSTPHSNGQEIGVPKVEPKRGLLVALRGVVCFQPSIRLDLQAKAYVEVTIDVIKHFVTTDQWKKAKANARSYTENICTLATDKKGFFFKLTVGMQTEDSIQLIGKIEPQWITDLFTNADKHGAFVRKLLRDKARDTEFDTVWIPKEPGEKIQVLDTIRDKAKRLSEFRGVTHRGRGGEISQLGIRVHHTGIAAARMTMLSERHRPISAAMGVRSLRRYQIIGMPQDLTGESISQIMQVQFSWLVLPIKEITKRNRTSTWIVGADTAPTIETFTTQQGTATIQELEMATVGGKGTGRRESLPPPQRNGGKGKGRVERAASEGPRYQPPARPTLNAWFGNAQPPQTTAPSPEAQRTQPQGLTVIRSMTVNDTDSDSELEGDGRGDKRTLPIGNSTDFPPLGPEPEQEAEEETAKRIRKDPQPAVTAAPREESTTPTEMPAIGSHPCGPGAASSSTDLSALKDGYQWLRQTVESQALKAAERERLAEEKHREEMAKFEAMLNQRMDEKLQQHSEENRVHLSAMMEEKLKLTFDAAAAHTSSVVQNSQKQITTELTNTMNTLLGGFMDKLQKKERRKKKDEEMSVPSSTNPSSEEDEVQPKSQKRTKGR